MTDKLHVYIYIESSVPLNDFSFGLTSHNMESIDVSTYKPVKSFASRRVQCAAFTEVSDVPGTRHDTLFSHVTMTQAASITFPGFKLSMACAR